MNNTKPWTCQETDSEKLKVPLFLSKYFLFLLPVCFIRFSTVPEWWQKLKCLKLDSPPLIKDRMQIFKKEKRGGIKIFFSIHWKNRRNFVYFKKGGWKNLSPETANWNENDLRVIK